MASMEMPKYRCHKEVWALKIKHVVCDSHPDPEVSIEEFSKTEAFSGGSFVFEDDGYAMRTFTPEWYRKHKPVSGGYLVIYKDGYESFSPAEAFEEGYTRI